MRPKEGGTPTSLHERIGECKDIATDGQYLYWTQDGDNVGMRLDAADGTISRSNLNNAGPPDILAQTDMPMALALDDAFVYWVEACGRVKKVAK